MLRVVKCTICGREIVALRNIYLRLRNHIEKEHKPMRPEEPSGVGESGETPRSA